MLGAVAAVLARFGDTETALRLLGSLERARAHWGVSGTALDLRAQVRLRERLTRDGDPTVVEQCLADGRSWPFDDAMNRAAAALAALHVE